MEEDIGFALGFVFGLAVCLICFAIWCFDATHDVSASMNQTVCMEVDEIGSRKCATDKELLEWLRNKK